VRIKQDSELDWEDATEEDYETIEVFDHVTVTQQHYINSVNGYETFTGKIAGGDDPSLDEPEAVTERVANLLWHEFGIDGLPSMGIRVVDIESDDVWVA
jgi:hypothetical protein